MKTKDEILKDIFGNKQINPIIHKAMEAYASQFRYIKTTCGQHIIFDEQDYDLLRDCTLYLMKNRNYVHVCVVGMSKKRKKTSINATKLILGVGGRIIVQYKDRNPLNLKRENLEVVTFQVSHFKEKIAKNNTSGYKGVSYSKFAKKHCAYIKVDGKKKHLGYFSDPIDAAKAYNKAAIEFFGIEYAELNDITS